MVMKRIFLLLSSLAVAILAGVAVFLWTGHSPAQLEKQGRKLEQNIQQGVQRGRQTVEQAKDVIKKIPAVPNIQLPVLPNAQQPPPSKKASEPGRVTPPPPVTPPASGPAKITPSPRRRPPTTPGPPMEDVNRKDKEKLKDILGQ